MPRLVAERLRDILEEIQFLRDTRAEHSLNSFLRDEVAKRAFVRSIEIIGEAAKAVPEDMRVLEPGLA